MMLQFTNGNLFESNAEALVNTVNTVGVMGKGVALQFKNRYPENYKLYQLACKKEQVIIGKMFITSTNSLMNPKWIINFPTKKDWKHNSSYSYIESGLDDLRKFLIENKVESIAIPPLGSGLGGLEWEKVKELIKIKLTNLDTNIIIYEPINQIQTSTSDKTNANLTKPRALILSLMDKYRILGFETSLLEIQKLSYFLQRLGQNDLNLNFKKFHYGPYSHNLQHLLIHLEGHYIISETAIADSKPFAPVYLVKEKKEEIKKFIKNECSPQEKERLDSVERIIDGYQSPYGLELLSSIDWVIKESNLSIDSSHQEIAEKIQEWSKRKAESLTVENIQKGIQHLKKFKLELQLTT